MALGDGIRRNIFSVSPEEQKRLVAAIVKLNQPPFVFQGTRTDFPAGGVTWWFKQDEIHQATHVHGGPLFLPWHREMTNRFEDMLRQVDPDLSLHYWDWNQDISPLFPLFGNMQGPAGEPWLSAGFYNPDPPGDNWRDDVVHDLILSGAKKVPAGYDLHANPADPPKNLKRNVQKGKPPAGKAPNNWPSDTALIDAPTYAEFNTLMIGPFEDPGVGAHDAAHAWLGLEDTHISFRDPLVFLLHSNVDRIWACWQKQKPSERLDPNKIYGDTPGSSLQKLFEAPLQPWAGTGPWPMRPWYAPENKKEVKNSKHPSIVTPRAYNACPLSSQALLGEANKWALVAMMLFGGVTQDGGGVIITPGGRPIPIDPWGPLMRLSTAKRDALAALAVTELATLINNPESRREVQKAGVSALADALEALRLELR